MTATMTVDRMASGDLLLQPGELDVNSDDWVNRSDPPLTSTVREASNSQSRSRPSKLLELEIQNAGQLYQ
jgi:hypothetical protein